MVLRSMELWRQVCDKAGVSASFSQEWWERVMERYNEPQRHYHTMNHIEELSGLYAGVEALGLFHRPDIIAWTIFFHDIIYDPTRNDNEDQSADVWLDFAADLASDVGAKDEQMVATVRQYILQTKNHTTCPLDAEKDLRLFLDMDLAVLGAPTERYAEYADQIAREYGHFPRDAYCSGRAKILRVFAQDAHLFKTEELSARFLANARENLAWEITQLESPPMVLEPVFFADRNEVLKFEHEARRGDPLRIAADDLDHMLAMTTGKMSMAFRHSDSKALLAMAIASLTPLTDRCETLYKAAFAPAVMNEPDETIKQRKIAEAAKAMAESEGGGYSPAVRGEMDVHGSHLMLHSVCVGRTLRRRGVATKLLKDYLTMVRADYPQVKRITAVVPQFMSKCMSRLGFVGCGPRYATDFGLASPGGVGAFRGASPIAGSPGTAGSPFAAVNSTLHQTKGGITLDTADLVGTPAIASGATSPHGAAGSPNAAAMMKLEEVTMLLPPA